MPKPGQGANTAKLQKIVTTFTTKFIHCFFMGLDFKFDVSIDQCNFAPPKKWVRMKEVNYLHWIIAQIAEMQFKDKRPSL